MHQDRSGFLWIGTYGGLDRFDPATERFTHYTHERGNPRTISGSGIWSICEDGRGHLWIGTSNRGLNRLDAESGQFTHYSRNPRQPHSIRDNQVWTLYADAGGFLWVGTLDGGLSRYLPEIDGFENYQMDSGDPWSIGIDAIACIHQDRSGILWIGTFGAGVSYYDAKKDRFELYRHDPGDPASLSSPYVSCFAEDAEHAVWIGTVGGGVSRLDRSRKKFIQFQYNENDPGSLSHNVVNLLYRDRRDRIWIGTSRGGLNRYDEKNGSFIRFNLDSQDPGRRLPISNVTAIEEDHKRDLWIGTFTNGLFRFNYSTNRVRQYENRAGNLHSLSENHVSALLADRYDQLWIGTADFGLNRYDRDQDRFTRYLHDRDDPGSLNDNDITVLFEDLSGNLWVGTRWGGLARHNRDTDDFTRYVSDPGDPHSLSHNTVEVLYQDRSGDLWIGTGGGGLNRLVSDDLDGARFFRYRQSDGLANDFIRGILEEDEGFLWISTQNGLSKFDPKRETFVNYDMDEGLQGNEFLLGACYRSESGEMFFGGSNGFNAFYPDRIVDNSYVPPIVYTDFSVPYRKQQSGAGAPLYNINETGEITLSYKENVFSIEFAALNFTNPSGNQYAYKLKGFDRDWINSGPRRFVTYTNLDPGNYIFEVKGSNNDGVWNEKGARLLITITPPFWARTWFRVLAAFFALFAMLAVYKRRLRNTRMEAELQAAHEAQMSIMPKTDPQLHGFDISGICIPANQVGGDFFDYFWMNTGKTRMGIALGDVSGKAMSSAMTAVMTDGMVYLEGIETRSIPDIMRRANRAVFQKTDKRMFSALCLVRLDSSIPELGYCNAGLTEPLLKKNGSTSFLKSSGSRVPLGLMEEVEYNENVIPFEPGDLLILYTDGITEALNRNRDLYGEERLMGLIDEMNCSTLSSRQIKNAVIQDVKRFAGAAEYQDDMTLVVVKRIEE